MNPPNGSVLRLPASHGMWTPLDVVASTGSTNADLLARAVAGAAPEGAVLVTEEQTAGRGRLGRSWSSVPGASLTFSVLLRPAVAAPRRGWVPLLAGLAVVAAVRAAGVDAVLKWPNDVLAGGGKLAGILAEQSSDGAAVVVGIGLNVAVPAGPVPASAGGLPPASLLALAPAGAAVAREALLLDLLSQLEARYQAFQVAADPAGSGLLAEYRARCATLGQPVRVLLPGDRELAGVASDVDAEGRLLVAAGDGAEIPVSAGDVIHVRS
jgi:BirA family biotin operon repressor/biotin-[acetyl-CoA-carboxylase] ligase